MATPITLQVFRGDQLLRTEQFTRDIIKIGRLATAHLPLDDDRVSRIHAVIEVAADGAISVIDMGSAEGTFVNGRKVSRSPLKPGDQLTVGGLRIALVVEGGGRGRGSSAPRRPPRPHRRPPAPAASPRRPARSRLRPRSLRAAAPAAATVAAPPLRLPPRPHQRLRPAPAPGERAGARRRRARPGACASAACPRRHPRPRPRPAGPPGRAGGCRAPPPSPRRSRATTASSSGCSGARRSSTPAPSWRPRPRCWSARGRPAPWRSRPASCRRRSSRCCATAAASTRSPSPAA